MVCHVVANGSIALGAVAIDVKARVDHEIGLVRSWRIEGSVSGRVPHDGVSWKAEPHGKLFRALPAAESVLCGKGLTAIADKHWVHTFVAGLSYDPARRVPVDGRRQFCIDVLPMPMVYRVRGGGSDSVVTLTSGDAKETVVR